MTGLKLTPYDSADYLDGHAAITAYLDAAKVEGSDDSAYMEHVRGVADRAHAKIAATCTTNKVEEKS